MQQDFDLRDTPWQTPGTNPAEDNCFGCGQKGHHWRNKRTGRITCPNADAPVICPKRRQQRLEREAKQATHRVHKSAENGRSRAQSFLARAFPQQQQQAQQQHSSSAYRDALMANAQSSLARVSHNAQDAKQKEQKDANSAAIASLKEQLAAQQQKQAESDNVIAALVQKQAENEKQIAAQTKQIAEHTHTIAQLREEQSAAKITAEQHEHSINAQREKWSESETNYLRYALDSRTQLYEHFAKARAEFTDKISEIENNIVTFKQLIVARIGAASNSTHTTRPPTQSQSASQFARNLQAAFSSKPRTANVIPNDSSKEHKQAEKAVARASSPIRPPSQPRSAPPSPGFRRSARRLKAISHTQLPQSAADVLHPISFAISPMRASKQAKQAQQQLQQPKATSESAPRGD